MSTPIEVPASPALAEFLKSCALLAGGGAA
jgi:hypothetical protein